MNKNEHPWTEPEEKIVQTIVENYRDSSDGRIRWRQAFDANPGWEKKLMATRTRGAIHAKGNHLRKSSHPVVVSERVRRTKGTWTPEQIGVIEQITEQYSTGEGNSVSADYAKAFAQHPEWRSILVGKSLNAIYSMGRKVQLKRNKRLAKESKEARNGHETVVQRPLDGKFIVITGTFRTALRSEIIRLIEEAGGAVRAAVNTYTSYLVTGTGCGQSKVNAALRARVPTLTEEQLYRLVGKPMPAMMDSAVTVDNTGLDASQPGEPRFAVNGCPNCMFNLKIMNDEYAKHGIEPPGFCPNCTFPVNIVRTAVRLANKHQAAL